MKSHTEHFTFDTKKKREQRVFYAELDGQRSRRLVVKVLGE